MISAAIQLIASFATPSYLQVRNLHKELSNIYPVDTVFFISETSYLKNFNGPVSTILHSTKKALYFKGHSHTKQSGYTQILNRGNFSKIDFIGCNRDTIDKLTYALRFFWCEIKMQLGNMFHFSKLW